MYNIKDYISNLDIINWHGTILLITNEIDKMAIIKKDKNTIPKDLKFDFKFNICLVDIIKEAKIQN